MPQNIQQSPNQQQVRLATLSPIHSQPTNQTQNLNLNQAQSAVAAQLKPQRFLIKSPPQYNQQTTPTSMVTIRAPIQNQQQINQLNQNQILPQTNKPQIVNKFAANQITGQIRAGQWTTTTGSVGVTNDQQQQLVRPVTPNQQMMQISANQVNLNQVIMSPAGIVQQTGGQHAQQIVGQQQTTMILQGGKPHNMQQHTIQQQHPISQTGQWQTTQIVNNNQQQQHLTPTMVQIRPTANQNLQMHTIQQQQQQQQSAPSTPTPVNRFQTATVMSSTATPNLASGGTSDQHSHQTPTITDPNVSNQVRIEQVNCIISSTSLQTLNADQSITFSNSSNSLNNANSSLIVTSKTKSALANLLNNRLKNSTQNISSNANLIKKDASCTLAKSIIDVNSKAIDALKTRNLDNGSPNSIDYSPLVSKKKRKRI